MIESEFAFAYFQLQQALKARLREQAPARIQLLTGPRQVGKTRLLFELARGEQRLRGNRAMGYLPDEPPAGR